MTASSTEFEATETLYRVEAIENFTAVSEDLRWTLRQHGPDLPAGVRSALERVVASLSDLRAAVSAAQRPGSTPATPAASQPQAQSSAPFVRLLRILGLCWRERHVLPAELVERLREQLEGPEGILAKRDERVLDAMSAISPFQLRHGHWRHEPVGEAELARRELEACCPVCKALDCFDPKSVGCHERVVERVFPR